MNALKILGKEIRLCYQWETLCCVNGGLGSWIPHEKIYVGIHVGIKAAGRKVSSTKQFIKAKVYS